ncbi:MAG TPA: sigma-54 dependent transcriptional regulator [Casimicrobiaceae bacterium]|nr:sigma-54 dependent transcriptional regulator [Myxococcota bacterium]HTS23028.1 sigma-54 dependent transcriptional regulator [Casimicrobiaceae bacterium]
MIDSAVPVYVVDDDPSMREALESLLRSAGARVCTFATAHEFLETPRPDEPSCLILDVELPGLSGLDLQRELVKSNCALPIVFLSGHADIPISVQAMKAGAVEFLTKPFRGVELLDAVQQAVQRYRPGSGRSPGSGSIIGADSSLMHVLELVKSVAPTGSTVLLRGETGTGKEVIARAIHEGSTRSRRDFVKVNCAAIPTGLLESELFGHERGAFTGAVAQRIGRFERASGGTLFLDEIGDIPRELQPKLLRVLQEQEFERLGATRTIQADVRLVAATNCDLEAMVADGGFRRDLYYRLNVFPITLPPLRERRRDIPALAWHFTERIARSMQKRIDTIPESTMDALCAHDWPGNVRELENTIERAVILSSGPALEVAPAELAPKSAVRPQAPATLVEAEREAIRRALDETHWRIGGMNGAADRLGMKRTTLQSRIRKLGLERPSA